MKSLSSVCYSIIVYLLGLLTSTIIYDTTLSPFHDTITDPYPHKNYVPPVPAKETLQYKLKSEWMH